MAWILVPTLVATLSGGVLVTEPVTFKVLETGVQSDIESPRTVVVRTPEQWKALCADHAGGRPCPAVDLTRSTVVGVFLGTRSSAGFAVEITRIEREGDTLVVNYRERKPGPNEMAAQMMTMPYQLVTIDRFAGPVRFVAAR